MIKTIAISTLLLGCFLVIAKLAPNLLKDTRPNSDNVPSKKNQDTIFKSIVLLIGMAIMLTLILHF